MYSTVHMKIHELFSTLVLTTLVPLGAGNVGEGGKTVRGSKGDGRISVRS
jgi:hypothetical protein